MEDKNSPIIKKKTWKIICYISIVFFFLALFFLANILSGLYFKKLVSQYLGENMENNHQICADCSQRSLDGVYVDSKEANLFPFAVMIDNHPDARPAYGLSQANLVIEAEAEGGITRYFAVFTANSDIDKIGPIRSVRPYFVDWAEELSALVVHCGGSPEALVRIDQENVYDLNEFYNEKLFWRDDTINAPHNVFTSTQNLRNYLSNKNLLAGKYLSWHFLKDIPETEALNPEIEIDYYSPSSQDNDFAVLWKYDTINNKYTRYLGGEKQKDGDGKEIKASNILIQYLQKEIIDDELRISLGTTGSGEAVICNLGKCEKGVWKKENQHSRTRFYDMSNQEINFVPGATWIEVVDVSIDVKY